jgi:acetylornithine deacetylase/succinyl-diaminopimelate desuccinylase-like protein
VNGAQWLTKNDLQSVDAELALTEGFDGGLDAQGHRVALYLLAAEKTYADYSFEVTNPGGHSSRPVPDNAIYRLARAVDRVSRYEFPVQLNDANRGYFSEMATVVGDADGAAMAAVVRDPHDAAAVAVLDKNPLWHAMLRTTCVATMLSAGHATNALPQRATANINCRIFPGVSREAILEQLQRIADDPAVKVRIDGNPGPVPPVPPLTAQVLEPVRKVAAQLWPGVPVVPGLEPGGSDAVYLNSAGIPTYGITGILVDPDGGHIHGLNERVRVRSVDEGRTFLYRLVKLYADQ